MGLVRGLNTMSLVWIDMRYGMIHEWEMMKFGMVLAWDTILYSWIWEGWVVIDSTWNMNEKWLIRLAWDLYVW